MNGAPFACTPYSKDALGNVFRDVREAFDPTGASSPTSGAIEGDAAGGSIADCHIAGLCDTFGFNEPR